MATRVVGLDFGHNIARAVEVEDPRGKGAKIVATAEVVLPDGAVRDGEVRELHTVATALKKLWATGGFKSKQVVLGMGNQRVLARDLTVPAMSPQQVRESLPFQVQDLLPVPAANAILDFYPVAQGDGENGPVLHGLLIAALKEPVMNNIQAVRLAGFEAISVDLIPFALTRLLADRGVDEAVAFIDVGATTTNVAVAVAGVPHFVRIIPAGGEDVTRALVERLELAPDQADQAKRALGLALAGADPQYRGIVEIIQGASSDLFTSLRSTLSYFETSRSRQVSRIVLTGGGADLQGFGSALADVTRVPVSHAEVGTSPALAVATSLAMGSAA